MTRGCSDGKTLRDVASRARLIAVGAGLCDGLSLEYQGRGCRAEFRIDCRVCGQGSEPSGSLVLSIAIAIAFLAKDTGSS